MHNDQTTSEAEPTPNPDERQFQAFSPEPLEPSSENREGPLMRMDAISLPMMQYLQQAGGR